MTIDREFPKSIDSLESIFTFLHESLTPIVADGHIIQVLTFGTEEFFTNCVKYNRKSRDDIRISIRRESETVSVQVIDTDVEPFDVTQVAPPSLDASAEARRPGGLGIHISRQLLDNLSYEYRDNASIITMTMELGE